MAAEDKKPICGMEGKILWIMAGRLSSLAPIRFLILVQTNVDLNNRSPIDITPILHKVVFISSQNERWIENRGIIGKMRSISNNIKSFKANGRQTLTNDLPIPKSYFLDFYALSFYNSEGKCNPTTFNKSCIT